MNDEDKPAEDVKPEHRRWESALRRVAAGEARFLLELLLSPTTTDGQGNPLTFEPLPDDLELRHRIVRALMARPDWAAGNIGKWWTHTGRGKQKPTLSDFEVSVVQVVNDMCRPKQVDMNRLADAYGVTPETLKKRVAERRRKMSKD